MKKTPVLKKKSTKARKQGFLSRSKNILKSRRQKGRSEALEAGCGVAHQYLGCRGR